MRPKGASEAISMHFSLNPRPQQLGLGEHLSLLGGLSSALTPLGGSSLSSPLQLWLTDLQAM